MIFIIGSNNAGSICDSSIIRGASTERSGNHNCGNISSPPIALLINGELFFGAVAMIDMDIIIFIYKIEFDKLYYLPPIMETHATFLLADDTATAPKKATPQSAAYDLYAAENVTIRQDMTPIATNLAIKLEPGYWVKIEARSGLALKYGMCIGAGVIDADYFPGLIRVLAYCVGGSASNQVSFKKGDKIAQFTIERILNTDIRIVAPDSPDHAELLAKKIEHVGFGSTDKK